jgi:hypothetical protein
LSLTSNLAAGVISSLIAVLLVEIYRLSRKVLTHRPLRRVFGPSDKRRAVVVPKFPHTRYDGSRFGLLATHDAIALAHILAVLNKFGIPADVLSSGLLPDEVPDDIVCIGGPDGNLVTEFYMRRYCPGFVIHGDKTEDGGYNFESSECGDRNFIDENDDCWAFIVKLSPAHAGLPGTILLLWGHEDIGTATAAFFVSHHASKLSGFSKDAFFVALLANSRLGYRSVQLTPIDLSEKAFQKAGDGSG